MLVVKGVSCSASAAYTIGKPLSCPRMERVMLRTSIRGILQSGICRRFGAPCGRRVAGSPVPVIDAVTTMAGLPYRYCCRRLVPCHRDLLRGKIEEVDTGANRLGSCTLLYSRSMSIGERGTGNWELLPSGTRQAGGVIQAQRTLVGRLA